MADLRNGAEAAGLRRVRTLLATGNLLFDSDAPEAEIQHALDAVLANHQLPENDVILRTAPELISTLRANPFEDAVEARPQHLLIHFGAAQMPPTIDWDGPERLCVAGRAVIIDYVQGVGRSKLTHDRLARMCGQPGTARNWRTTHRILAEMGH